MESPWPLAAESWSSSDHRLARRCLPVTAKRTFGLKRWWRHYELEIDSAALALRTGDGHRHRVRDPINDRAAILAGDLYSMCLHHREACSRQAFLTPVLRESGELRVGYRFRYMES